MSDQLIDGQVIPYPNGRRNHDTATWRDATEMEISQAKQIQELQGEVDSLHDAKNDLIEALKVARHMIVEDGTPIGWSVSRLDEVIAKAKGAV
jgi:hypothetical protein